MRAVVQRISQASVTVGGRIVGSIDEPGLLVLVGVTHDDTPAQAARLAAKLWGLRILAGELSCSDVGAPLLVVSQFTLYGDTGKGRRPSWITPHRDRWRSRWSRRWWGAGPARRAGTDR